MISNLRERVRQMASVLNTWYAATDEDDLVGSSQGIIRLQGEIMREQDEVLDRLEETALVTKHFALALNEELNMHARLIVQDSLDPHGIVAADLRLKRVQKRLEILNQRNKAGCSCIMCLLLSVLAIVVLALIPWILVKYFKGRLYTSSQMLLNQIQGLVVVDI